MNCRRFQRDIYEYLDGSLSPRAQAAAETHLAGCAVCRQKLQAERRVGSALSHHFRAATESLELPPEVGRRVTAALTEEQAKPARPPSLLLGEDVVVLWRRWVWPLAAAAAALVMLAAFLYFAQGPAPGTRPLHPRFAGGGVSVQLSYVAPVYTFRQEGGLVVDALTCQTNVVNERLGP